MQQPTILVGDRELVVPEINLEELENFGDDLEFIANASGDKSQNWPKIRLMTKIVIATITRAHPDVDVSEIRKSLTVKQALELFGRVLGNDPKAEPQQPLTS